MPPPSPTNTSPALAAAVKIIERLHGSGHVAYLAGGCVRDSLLGRTPKDFDVATDALPDVVLKCFRQARYVGEAFGVVLVRVDGFDIEVATFRLESGYDDGRRPTNVEFTDAQHDAKRRDFTINGLFADPLPTPQQILTPDCVTERTDPALPETARALGRIIDFVGGRADLAAHTLRAIGNPDERFAEDYLRMLRAVRFTARLGFELEQSTARAIRVHAKYLSQISRERIGLELLPMLSIASPEKRVRAAQLIQSLQLDGPTLNEERADAALPTLAALAIDADYPTALAAWMFDRHFIPLPAPLKKDDAEAAFAEHVDAFMARQCEKLVTRWRKALTLSNEHRDALHATLMLLPRTIRWRTFSVAQKKRLLAAPRSAQAVLLLAALSTTTSPVPAGLLVPILHDIAAEAPTLQAQGVAPEPIVTGDDLISHGLHPSRRFKQLLDHFYDLQLEGQLRTKDDFERFWNKLETEKSGENG